MNDTNKTLKIALGILGAVAVVLLILLFNSRKQGAEQAKTVIVLSNQVQQTSVELQDNKQTLTNLETELVERQADILSLSNTLSETLTNLETTQASLQVAQEAITKLEAHNQALEGRAAELNEIITGLTAKIEDITKKLTAAEGDNAALSAELKRLTAEKEELEREFNDLTSLKAQVKKIKSEHAIAQRLKWQRAGIQTMEPKGAEKLTGTGAAAPAAQKPNYELNVEIDSDGSIKVIPPLNTEPAK